MRTELASRPSVKGEITLLIGKTDEVQADDTPLEEAVRAAEQQGLPRMEAIKHVARQRGLSKREVYRLIAGARPAEAPGSNLRRRAPVRARSVRRSCE